MILATHGIIGSSIGGFDADYQAILDYATTQSYTLPSASQQIKQNQLLVDLKSAGIWSKLDTFAVFATDGSSNFALIDWKRLSQYTAVNSPTFTNNQGFQGNGTSSYINTNFNLFSNSVNYAVNDSSIGVYKKSGTSSGDKCLIGVLQTGPTLGTHFNSSDNIRNNSSTGASSLIWGNGLCSLVRNSNLSYNSYNAGSKIPNSIVVSSAGLPNSNVFILARSVNNSLSFPSDEQVSISYIGGDITSEYSDFVDALDNYIASI
jgi:hypothetical protein